MIRLIAGIATAALSVGGSFAARPQQFTAKAYSLKGSTANGGSTRRGIAAADPAVIPLGARIRIRGAGKYSGVYTVNDTGAKVSGREVDIFIPNEAAAKRFGKKDVTVQILTRGDAKK